MPIVEKSITQLTADFVANKETALSVSVPILPKSFLRVESAIQAGAVKGLEKMFVDSQKSCLAKTAKEQALTEIGREYGIERTEATKAKFSVTATSESGSYVDQGIELQGVANSAYYLVDATANESGGSVTFDITAQEAGEASMLQAGDTLTFTAPALVPGVSSVATIVSIETVGENRETLSAYRARVLFAQRKISGGGNLADYKDWAESVPGVEKAFPYSGKPIVFRVTNTTFSFDETDNSINDENPRGDGAFNNPQFGELNQGDMIAVVGSASNDGRFDVVSVAPRKIVVDQAVADEAIGENITIENCSQPGDRTVFIMSTEDEDGIPSEDLLELVREGINRDEDGIMRPGVADIDSCLYVEPIRRTAVDVSIQYARIDPTQNVAAKAAVVTDITAHLLELTPYIEGLDFEMDRNDFVTMISVSSVVQRVLKNYGGSADLVILSFAGKQETSYQLGQGEFAKLGAVTWVDTVEE